MPERTDVLKSTKVNTPNIKVYFIECSVFVNFRFDIDMYLSNKYFYMSHSLV